MNVPAGLADKLLMNERLRNRSYIGIGGRALYYIAVQSIECLQTAVAFAKDEGVTMQAIGMGTNVLIADTGVDALILHLEGAFSECVISDGKLRAGGGCSLNRLINTAIDAGISGLEVLAGIPSTVGGAIRMNAGGKYGAIADSLDKIMYADGDGGVHTVKAESLDFGYRTSRLPQDAIVLEAVFRMEKGDPVRLKASRDLIIQEKKESQPLAARSLGCVFKNTETESAGALIDRCGLKGKRHGDIAISDMHANFLINTGKGTSRDMIALMELIYNTVENQTGIQLEPEIHFFGNCGWRY